MRERYTQEEVNEILLRAVESQPTEREVTREQLASLAEEVGISPETLRIAEERWLAEGRDLALRDSEDRRAFQAMRAVRRRAVRGFWTHLIGYICAVVVVFAIAMEEDDFLGIALFFMVPWFAALAAHGAHVFLGGAEDEELAFRKWQRARRERLDGDAWTANRRLR